VRTHFKWKKTREKAHGSSDCDPTIGIDKDNKSPSEIVGLIGGFDNGNGNGNDTDKVGSRKHKLGALQANSINVVKLVT